MVQNWNDGLQWAIYGARQARKPYRKNGKVLQEQRNTKPTTKVTSGITEAPTMGLFIAYAFITRQ